MPRRIEGLSAAKVAKAGAGRYGDGNGLYLLVRPSRGKVEPGKAAALMRFWLFRYTRGGKMREMGLGAADATGKNGLGLADARARARKLADVVRDGRDPLAERDAEEARRKAEEAAAAVAGMTFKQSAERYIAAHEAGWKNSKHRQQWGNTLRDYAYPEIGALPVSAIDTGHVTKILEPIWREKPETASRLRGRLEQVLDYARVMGWRQGENPARWRGHLDHLLPGRAKIARIEHHSALPWREVGAFMEALAADTNASARALEFTILTATRTNEVLGARWGEIDLGHKIWTIPAERMKAGREHRVPLSARAMKILAAIMPLRDQENGDFLFPGRRQDQPLSNMAMLMALRRMKRDDLTTHGFRSSFRDWVAEATGYPGEIAEMALAHAISDRVEAAYRRGDLFEKRRLLMDEWAEFCSRPAPEASGMVALLNGTKR